VKALDKIEKIELPKKRRVVKFDFRQPPRSGDIVATLEHVAKAYGKRVVHADLSLTIQRGERWCVMGKNGAGKSTLLKMVAGAIDPDGGAIRLGASLNMGYFSQQALDVLDADLTIEEQLEKDFPHESIGARRGLAGAFQFSQDEIDKKIRALSGGEKTRLVMARMLLHPPNFLVLDEPTNHLDLATKEMLIDALMTFEGTMRPCRTIASLASNRKSWSLVRDRHGRPHAHAYPGSHVEYRRTGHKRRAFNRNQHGPLSTSRSRDSGQQR
jgi:ATPase subunit of ABC transporter with duplicated ATPase domains